MSQPQPGPPTGTPGTISPDGAYIWNGTQWIPNAPGQAVPAKKKGHFWRNGAIGCGGIIALLVVIGIAAGGHRSSTPGTASNSPSTQAASSPTAKASTAPAKSTCSPQPCASASSLTVHITGLNPNEPSGFLPPEAGNHLVLMQMTMHNDGGSDTKNANPFDFKLKDAAGLTHNLTFSDAPGCDTWSAVDLAPGATLGPKPLCFEASGAPTGKLTLVWTPEIFSSPVQIPLQ